MPVKIRGVCLVDSPTISPAQVRRGGFYFDLSRNLCQIVYSAPPCGDLPDGRCDTFSLVRYSVGGVASIVAHNYSAEKIAQMLGREAELSEIDLQWENTDYAAYVKRSTGRC